jgi:hypothetical protein
MNIMSTNVNVATNATNGQLSVLNELIDELTSEMWYNIHSDAPHQAHKVKGWIDQLKTQATQLNNQLTNNSTNSMTKQFKIGERCIGGIIRVDITKEEPDRSLIEVKALDWNTKKVVKADWAETDNSQWHRNIDNTLNEMTTSYYSDKVMKWIDEKINQLEKK